MARPKQLHHKLIFFISVLVILLVFPLIGSLIKWGGLPPGFGIFPSYQQGAPDEPGFSLICFILGIGVAVVIMAFLLFPKWFGFKGGPSPEEDLDLKDEDGDGIPNEFDEPMETESEFKIETTEEDLDLEDEDNNALPDKLEEPIIDDSVQRIRMKLPIWFWVGAFLNVVSWIAMWGQFSWLGSAVQYTFVPLWWGFILVIDGLVYRRTGGDSLLSTYPRFMLALVLMSVVGWFLFEYYNYFIMQNWYYPDSHSIMPSVPVRIFWFALSYTVVWPAIFEWYWLLGTFKFMKRRYTNGPKLTFLQPGLFTKKKFLFWLGVFVVGMLLTFGFGIMPYALFWALWLGPLLLLASALAIVDYGDAYTIPISNGNWTRVILFALASLANGVFWECWNFWSSPANPHYWKYEIPYMDKFHIFEMPVLGFFGYIPFGLLCWVLFLLAHDLLELVEKEVHPH